MREVAIPFTRGEAIIALKNEKTWNEDWSEERKDQEIKDMIEANYQDQLEEVKFFHKRKELTEERWNNTSGETKSEIILSFGVSESRKSIYTTTYYDGLPEDIKQKIYHYFQNLDKAKTIITSIKKGEWPVDRHISIPTITRYYACSTNVALQTTRQLEQEGVITITKASKNIEGFHIWEPTSRLWKNQGKEVRVSQIMQSQNFPELIDAMTEVLSDEQINKIYSKVVG